MSRRVLHKHLEGFYLEYKEDSTWILWRTPLNSTGIRKGFCKERCGDSIRRVDGFCKDFYKDSIGNFLGSLYGFKREFVRGGSEDSIKTAIRYLKGSYENLHRDSVRNSARIL